MAAATKSTSAGLVAVRSREMFFSAPGVMGFENLLKPDDAFDKLSFKVQLHHNEAQQELLGRQIQKYVIDANKARFLAECEESGKAAPKGGWVFPEGAEWVANHMKDPTERSRTQLPSISWRNDAEFRDKKTGEMTLKVMRAYDAANTLLDLKALKLGMGSIIQAGLIGGMFVSPLVKQPELSFKLQGVRVLRLVSYGAGQGHLAEVSDEDMAEGFSAESLGSYAAPNKDTTKAPQEREHVVEEEDLPF